MLAVGALWRTGYATELDRETMQGWASGAGWWGPLAFVALFAIGELLHIPSVIFVVIAGLVWPTGIALVTAYLGALLASAVVFLMARYFVSGALREVVKKRMPAVMQRYDAALVTRGIRTVALIRLVTFMAPAMHWVLATSRVRFGDMMLGTAIGLVPGITALVLGGDAAVRHWETAQPWILAAVGVLLLLRLAKGHWQSAR